MWKTQEATSKECFSQSLKHYGTGNISQVIYLISWYYNPLIYPCMIVLNRILSWKMQADLKILVLNPKRVGGNLPYEVSKGLSNKKTKRKMINISLDQIAF